MYELIILTLLMRAPTHGYLIAQVIHDVIGPFARASNGRLYPLLTKLVESGMISVQEEWASDGGRLSRSFAITVPGRARFLELMRDTSSSPREYRELFAFKVAAFDQIEAGDRLALIRHYAGFCRAHIEHLMAQARDLSEHGPSDGHSLAQGQRFASLFGHLVEVWQGELRWAEQLLRDEPQD
ncbi:PadR family transcriptional regulator [Stigmatella sp. ncwal1]|uniref:PadR family transcriptional regulator n=1 Tax=Stigmatella ashevillensis TaxID=2995309 RepID=A0ABT5DM70_9BACT|nr:PadR family transcriptional regulator [Stigmatella ashevillena]MDC0714694.1 PadR family transcriptional regulator [Stigmatella ashevillena]